MLAQYIEAVLGVAPKMHLAEAKSTSRTNSAIDVGLANFISSSGTTSLSTSGSEFPTEN